jgi:hypothetical protein
MIKESEKLPNKVKNLLEKSKNLNNEWNNNEKNNKLNFSINECINIENNIKKINNINKYITKCNSMIITINFIPELDEDIYNYFKEVKKFGKIIIEGEDVYEIKTLLMRKKKNIKILK